MIFQAKSIGIDIQRDSVRVAVATAQGGRTKILAVLEKRIPEPPEGEERDSPGIVREALRELGADEDVCVICLPAANSINRLLTVPLTDLAKIKQTLKFQLETQIPYPVDQVISDFIPVRRVEDGSEILAVAVTKEAIAEKIQLLESAAGRPNILTLDALALADFYITPFDFSDDMITALLLVGSEHSFLGFFVGEKLIGYRNLEGLAAGDESGVRDIIAELRRSIVGFQSSAEEDAEVAALCVGGLDGGLLRDYLAEQFRDIPVRRIEFNERMLVDIPPQFGEETENCQLAIALAHAGVRGSANTVNFMQEEYAPPSVISRLKPNIKFGLILLAVLFLAWFVNIRAQIYRQSGQLEALNEEMVKIFADTMPGIKSPSAAEQRIKEEREKFKSLRNYSSEYVSPLEVLDSVAAAVPAGINLSLNDLAGSDNVLRMTGIVDSYDDIDAFKKRIENSPIFSDVSIDSMNVSKKTNKVNFRIRAEIGRKSFSVASPQEARDSS